MSLCVASSEVAEVGGRPDDEVASSEVAEMKPVIRPQFTGGIGDLRELLILKYIYFIAILLIYGYFMYYIPNKMK